MTKDVKAEYEKLSGEYPKGTEWAYCGGGSYRMIGVELDATSYEENGHPSFVVRYEQLNEGTFPKGQIWVRSVEDFTSKAIINGTPVPKFTKV